MLVRATGAAVLTASMTAAAFAQGDGKPLPYKYVGPPTVPAITPGDLMTRLYKYADDSMMGRQVGTPYNIKATAYIESEVRRLGLVPAGENGTYFQTLGMVDRHVDTMSTVTVGGTAYRFGADFIAAGGASIKQFANTPTIFGGQARDTTNLLDSATVAGKVLLVTAAAPITSQAQFDALNRSDAYKAYLRSVAGAARVVTIVPSIPATTVAGLTRNQTMLADQSGASLYPQMNVTMALAEAILGQPVTSATKGTLGKPISSDLRYVAAPNINGRNVVAILPGTDPKLKNEYVAIGAHNDHVGFAPTGQCGRTMASDSQHVWNAYGRPAGAEGGRNIQQNPITADEWAAINAKTAELRKSIPERADSICNGADDDGSGTVSVLEIAEAFAKGPIKPKRSILFVWHAGEEMGMWGSGYFMDHPTVPRDSIVAQLNIDMVGRGEASDVTGRSKDDQVLHGAPNYLQLVGSRRLSTELGDMVESVNKSKNHNMMFDYSEDADGHPQNIYCRSDHWSYGKWGVPVVFFTTGGHADYHQVTDEPQYIQYGHMAKVDSLIFDVAVAVANLDHRVVVDHPKPNPAPAMSCKQ